MGDKFFKGMLTGLCTALVVIIGTYFVMNLIQGDSDERIKVADGQYISIVKPEDRMPVTSIKEGTAKAEDNKGKEDNSEKKSSDSTEKDGTENSTDTRNTESADSEKSQNTKEENTLSRAEMATLFEKKLNFILTTINTCFYDEMDDEAAYEAMLTAAVESLQDPYSQYLPAVQYEESLQKHSGEYYGIGVLVGEYHSTQDADTRIFLIQYVYPGSTAEKAGLQAGDCITKIEGTPILEMTLDEAVEVIKGKEGTTVSLEIMRNGETFTVEVERGSVELHYVSGMMLENNIGYIQLSRFYDNTPAQFEETIKELEEQGMEALIVDVRSNPGGLYYSCCDCLDCIIEEGKLLVYDETKDGRRTEMYSKTDAHFDKPIVIITDENTASAAEIFAMTLQEYGRAVVVGRTTYGKGIVQQTISIPYDNSAIKLTVSKYYSPNGVCIHKRGVIPDVEVESRPDFVADEEHPYDPEISAAISEAEKLLNHD